MAAKRRRPPRDERGRFLPRAKIPMWRRPKVEKRGGAPPPTPSRAPAEILRAERRRRKKRVERAAYAPGSAARRLLFHVERSTAVSWGLTSTRPRRYWDSRHSVATRRRAHYEEVYSAFVRFEGDRIAVRALSGRVVSFWLRLLDPDRGTIWIRAGAAALFERAADDAEARLLEWTQRYGRDAKPDEPSLVREVVMYVGKRGGGE